MTVKLIGRTIVGLTEFSKTELRQRGWDRSPVIIVLDDGTKLIPMMDEEGNGPGELIAYTISRAEYLLDVGKEA